MQKFSTAVFALALSLARPTPPTATRNAAP